MMAYQKSTDSFSKDLGQSDCSNLLKEVKEKVQKLKEYGMSEKELSKRYSIERDEDTAIQTRLDEYSMSKIDLTIEMIRRAVKHKIRFRYVLADSWFTCAKIVKFIRSRHIKCDYIGMIKVGKEGRTKCGSHRQGVLH